MSVLGSGLRVIAYFRYGHSSNSVYKGAEKIQKEIDAKWDYEQSTQQVHGRHLLNLESPLLLPGRLHVVMKF